MTKDYGLRGGFGLENHGLRNLRNVYWNLSAPELVEHAIRAGEGDLADAGQVIVETGEHTGRSAKDKYIVREPELEGQLWWGEVNQPISPESFEKLFEKILAHYEGKDAYVLDALGGADPAHQLPIRVVTEQAWHNLFGRNLFLRLPPERISDHVPVFTILHAPSVLADPDEHGTQTGTFIILNLKRNMALIGGTSYAGEIKKTIFTVLNYTMPLKGILSMHCSANLGDNDDVALFFGLSGTGKTTLSSVPERYLIGDDEHGWGEAGVFNFEGGCYAKMIRLRAADEPIIWAATERFGTVLENVVFNTQSREPNFDDDQLTENTRGAYPIHFVPNYVAEGRAGHPNNIFFLTADAFGVMPPISRLTLEQAM